MKENTLNWQEIGGINYGYDNTGKVICEIKKLYNSPLYSLFFNGVKKVGDYISFKHANIAADIWYKEMEESEFNRRKINDGN